ncbi:MAG TPA: type II secretion system secretin GspD [Woeseiaceae bacterium]|nr:type II secretion system secretin GspD [Woeseiaceae bacterium]
MKFIIQRQLRCLGQAALAIILVNSAIVVAHAQDDSQAMITPNYKEADIRQIVEAVGEITHRTFIIDPRVQGAKVTMLSSTPMTPDAFYEAFLSILDVHQLAAVTTGNITKIIPNATARQYAGPIGVTNSTGPDDIVTQVIQVQNIGATQLVPILRPLVPQYGHLVAHPGSNMLIISDRAANVERLVQIIRRIDQAGDEEIEVIPLQHASASEVVRVVTALTQTPRADGAPVTTSLVADARTNSVLLGGDKSDRLRLRALIAHLDTPLEDGGDTQVRYLRYADAEELAGKLQQHIAGTAAQGAAAAGAAAGPQVPVQVWADPQTNAIIINAPPKDMRSVMAIVDKLDIRRPQVLVEAIIVEVLESDSADLGVSWAVVGEGGDAPVAVTNFPAFGPGVVQLAGALGASGDGGTTTSPTSLIGEGATIGIGRITDTGVSFAAILRALQGNANTNIISTPSILTTDNEEASLNIGQEVPFVSGQYTNTGGGNNGSVNPFTTVSRESVGVKLTITPQINEGDSLLLKISQEISNIAASSQGAVDLITNQRIIETTVIVDDGNIIVLGGLIEDTLRESEQRVPVLGSVPLLGGLFRTRSTEKVKTNLLIFIRPQILRDADRAWDVTNEKYNYLRNVQLGSQGGSVQLMPGEPRPILAPLDDGERAPMPPADNTPPDESPSENTSPEEIEDFPAYD